MKSHAELTDFKETSRYEDVIRFFADLEKQSPLVHSETFGHSHEARALPLIIISDPPISQPSEAISSGKAVVFVMANIHAGEVEGKEAVQSLARRLVGGDLRPVLKNLVLLIAPIYNADGNEKINPRNRPDQYGPLGGVGVRENGQGLDLNRDYMKLEAPESRALMALFNKWDPHLTVDLHTTDGSYHAYHLTYSPTLNPMADARLIAYEREQMLPRIQSEMLDKHHYRTYYYGNFSTREALDNELDRFTEPKPGQIAPTKVWRTFDHRPRFGNNYVGLRNRMTILSEAYSHLDFRRRVEVTEAFVEEILKYAGEHATEIRSLTKQVDADLVANSAVASTFGVQFEMAPLPAPVKLLVGDVTRIKHPVTGLEMIAMVEDKVTPVEMPDFGVFKATREVTAASYYLFPNDSVFARCVETLKAHGIAVEELVSPLKAEVQMFLIEKVAKAGRAFAGHNSIKLSGHSARETVSIPAGSLLVRRAQPLGRLASYLLEPESDDGLVYWNFLDAQLLVGTSYPILKVMENLPLKTRPYVLRADR